jgi:hypothetical protein
VPLKAWPSVRADFVTVLVCCPLRRKVATDYFFLAFFLAFFFATFFFAFFFAAMIKSPVHESLGLRQDVSKHKKPNTMFDVKHPNVEEINALDENSQEILRARRIFFLISVFNRHPPDARASSRGTAFTQN